MLGARKLVVRQVEVPVQLAGPVPAPPPTPVLAPGPEEVAVHLSSSYEMSFLTEFLVDSGLTAFKKNFF